MVCTAVWRCHDGAIRRGWPTQSSWRPEPRPRRGTGDEQGDLGHRRRVIRFLAARGGRRRGRERRARPPAPGVSNPVTVGGGPSRCSGALRKRRGQRSVLKVELLDLDVEVGSHGAGLTGAAGQGGPGDRVDRRRAEAGVHPLRDDLSPRECFCVLGIVSQEK